MRRIILAATLVSACGAYAFAQTVPNPVSLSFTADTIRVRPAFGYDGIVREGKADNILTATGNVIVVVNDMRLTSNTAAWHWDSKEIELAGGVRIELPAVPTSLRYQVR